MNTTHLASDKPKDVYADSYFDQHHQLTEAGAAQYARAMQEDTVDELPKALRLHIEHNDDARTQVIDYYLWLEAPDTRTNPFLLTHSPGHRKGPLLLHLQRSSPLIGVSVAAVLLTLFLAAPFAYRSYQYHRQEQQYIENFTEDPAREAIFMGTRMDAAGPAVSYRFRNTMTENGTVARLTTDEDIRLEWQLRPQSNVPFRPQQVELQFWDTQEQTPIRRLTLQQLQPDGSWEGHPDLAPGIYYARLKFGQQTQTLAKIRYYQF